jgi:hypothetical protein
MDWVTCPVGAVTCCLEATCFQFALTFVFRADVRFRSTADVTVQTSLMPFILAWYIHCRRDLRLSFLP